MATIKCPYCSSKIKLERFQYKEIVDSELNDKYVEENRIHKITIVGMTPQIYM